MGLECFFELSKESGHEIGALYGALKEWKPEVDQRCRIQRCLQVSDVHVSKGSGLIATSVAPRHGEGIRLSVVKSSIGCSAEQIHIVLQ